MRKNSEAAMNRWLALLGFLVLVVGGGLAIGFLTAPGAWYAGLAKPSFNPPGWVFAPVWTLLYVLIAVAGWRVSCRESTEWAVRLWWLQLALNFIWSPLFFAAHGIGLALVVILLLLGVIVVFIAISWRNDRFASWLFTPYATWVGFASLLNANIFALN